MLVEFNKQKEKKLKGKNLENANHGNRSVILPLKLKSTEVCSTDVFLIRCLVSSNEASSHSSLPHPQSPNGRSWLV